MRKTQLFKFDFTNVLLPVLSQHRLCLVHTHFLHFQRSSFLWNWTTFFVFCFFEVLDPSIDLFPSAPSQLVYIPLRSVLDCTIHAGSLNVTDLSYWGFCWDGKMFWFGPLRVVLLSRSASLSDYQFACWLNQLSLFLPLTCFTVLQNSKESLNIKSTQTSLCCCCFCPQFRSSEWHLYSDQPPMQFLDIFLLSYSAFLYGRYRYAHCGWHWRMWPYFGLIPPPIGQPRVVFGGYT